MASSVREQILIVEDNPQVVEVIEDALREKGYGPLATDTVAEAKRLFNTQHFDLVLLDVTLKDGSGHEVCRHIREGTRRPTTPIIILSGAAALEDKAQGIGSGADYYLTKPIAASDLLLWIRALLRRVKQDWSRGTTIGVRGLRVNPDIRTVWCERKIVRGLTAKEFDILLALARALPAALSREELHKQVWGAPQASNTLGVHIQRLRAKLGPKCAAHIVTLPIGYRLE